ncbi:MAG: hypothetical protein JWN70_2440 [Planctomycetaceae bacterium]|nr:hypothetical protein [Planctomycetaceae bacterium]
MAGCIGVRAPNIESQLVPCQILILGLGATGYVSAGGLSAVLKVTGTRIFRLDEALSGFPISGSATVDWFTLRYLGFRRRLNLLQGLAYLVSQRHIIRRFEFRQRRNRFFRCRSQVIQ